MTPPPCLAAVRAALALAAIAASVAASPPSSDPAAAAAGVVLHDIVGPLRTNTYLLYDTVSREAALIDVGGAPDALTTAIDRRGLKLKYILNTHGHVDHVEGVAAIRARYPGALWCMSRAESEDFAHYARWAEALPPDEVAQMKARLANDPAMAATFNFDFSRLGSPDVFLEDGQTLRLGNLEIRALLVTGHSRGGLCFATGHVLFSGDTLQFRRPGRSDLPGGGGPAALETSIRRLYELPEETVVYPGHGPFTEIGLEKTHNRGIRAPAAPQPAAAPQPERPVSGSRADCRSRCRPAGSGWAPRPAAAEVGA